MVIHLITDFMTFFSTIWDHWNLQHFLDLGQFLLLVVPCIQDSFAVTTKLCRPQQSHILKYAPCAFKARLGSQWIFHCHSILLHKSFSFSDYLNPQSKGQGFCVPFTPSRSLLFFRVTHAAFQSEAGSGSEEPLIELCMRNNAREAVEILWHHNQG